MGLFVELKARLSFGLRTRPDLIVGMTLQHNADLVLWFFGCSPSATCRTGLCPRILRVEAHPVLKFLEVSYEPLTSSTLIFPVPLQQGWILQLPWHFTLPRRLSRGSHLVHDGFFSPLLDYFLLIVRSTFTTPDRYRRSILI